MNLNRRPELDHREPVNTTLCPLTETTCPAAEGVRGGSARCWSPEREGCVVVPPVTAKPRRPRFLEGVQRELMHEIVPRHPILGWQFGYLGSSVAAARTRGYKALWRADCAHWPNTRLVFRSESLPLGIPEQRGVACVISSLPLLSVGRVLLSREVFPYSLCNALGILATRQDAAWPSD